MRLKKQFNIVMGAILAAALVTGCQKQVTTPVSDTAGAPEVTQADTMTAGSERPETVSYTHLALWLDDRPTEGNR